MKCPHCIDSILAITDRQGVEIDYCPVCRGVWLDRGELDKLLDKALAAQPHAAMLARVAPVPQHRDFEESDFNQQQRYPRSRKKSWLHEIFD